METELSFNELRRREVINGSDGRRLGHVVDVIFTVETGKLNGIILPYGRRGIFSRSQDLFIPWSCVQKIGEDVILVEITDLATGDPSCVPVRSPEVLPKPAPPPRPSREDCDGKCEKCMLFECSRRWSAC